MTSSQGILEDRSLAELALAGQPEYFSALMDRHLAAVRMRIRYMLRSEADSEDLIQEVVLKVWLHLSRFRWESSFRTWMTRVAINEVLQLWRRPRHIVEQQASNALSEPASSTESPDQTLARAREIQMVRKAVMRLPEIYRSALILFELEELSLREAAQQLRTSIPALKSRLLRGRRMLLAELRRSNRRGLASAA